MSKVVDQEINELADLEKVHRQIEGLDEPEIDTAKADDTVEQGDAKVEPVATQEAESSVAVKEYTPTLSYKVKDEERVFDERFKTIIKSKDDEDYIRDLYTRADGLPLIKEKLEATESRSKQYEQTVATLQETAATAYSFFNDIKESVKGGNTRKAIDKLGIDEDAVIRAALEIVQEREMPEQQRRTLQSQRELASHNEMILQEHAALRQQNQMLMQQHNEYANSTVASTQTQELNGHINGKYSDLNKRLGDAGVNMFDEAVSLGRDMFARTNQLPDIGQLVDSVASKYSKLMGQPVQTAPVASQVQTRPASIPKVNDSGKTAMGAQVTSIDDLRKRLDTFNKG